MGVPLANAIFLAGTTEPGKEFAANGSPGDWQIWPINFRFELPGHVTIIVTPNNRKVGDGTHVAAPVGIAQKVTNSGFLLAARNSDCAAGAASFDWIAISDMPLGKPQNEIPFVRMRMVQKKGYAIHCTAGDTMDRQLTFWKPLPDPAEFVFLTATDSGVYNHNAAVVGIVEDPNADGFNLHSRNNDSAAGECAFNFFAITTITPPPSGDAGNLLVDTGTVAALDFAPGGQAGDTKAADVDFHQPYSETPIVLLTANDNGVVGGTHNAAAVGIAQGVTRNGFTLTARNSDSAAGQCGFYWVAIGCGIGCG